MSLSSLFKAGQVAYGEATFSGALPYLLARQPMPGPVLVVAAGDDEAEALAADLAAYGVLDVVCMLGDVHVSFGDVSSDPGRVAQRQWIRRRLLDGEPPGFLIVSPSVLQSRAMPGDVFERHSHRVLVGDDVDRQWLSERLLGTGYQRVDFVEDEGTFAVRGGVVDIFAPGSTRPLRIDFFGDEIASIKSFDPESQRAHETFDSFSLFPIREVVFDSETSVPRACAWLKERAEVVSVPTAEVRALTEQIRSENFFFGIEAIWPVFYERTEPVFEVLLSGLSEHPGFGVVVQDRLRLEAELERRWHEASEAYAKAAEQDRFCLPVDAHLVLTQDLLERLAQARSAYWVGSTGEAELDTKNAGAASHTIAQRVDMELLDNAELVREMALRRENRGLGELLDPLERFLQQRVSDGCVVLLACGALGGAERLRELLRGRGFDAPIVSSPLTYLRRERNNEGHRVEVGVFLVVAPLAHGVYDRDAKLVVLAETELLGTAPPPSRRRRRRWKASAGSALGSLDQLAEGDLVVHVDHGIGRYLGLRRLFLHGVEGDYVHLEYADDDKLYVPVYRLNVLQVYRGTLKRLDKLGGQRWDNAKRRVRDAVLHMAHDLLAMQAHRNAASGLALGPLDEHFRSFEATFPFEETPDQKAAIEAVLSDLTSGRVMDRLICGDVGFGKTEVAIRATYLAVMSGRQVAVLVPTTVLAEQHGQTFATRLEAEGLEVAVLSRFRSTKQQQEIASGLREGRIDVVVGTHRVLSSDVAFKKLGLLVVDEEQRFGVKHKERIKQLRKDVHVLTLSATPIPRTLHMAMVGLRDFSVIRTPPVQRTPIRTEVARFDEELVAEAIRRELHRGGQVFVVHNRVQSIHAFADSLRQLVPESRIDVGHGGMSGEQLERVMVQFVRRSTDVLVCTAIIESGIDIPSVNTMIINRADTFGLAQLHQLRGRIGRGSARAYAYLLLPREGQITRDAGQRLSVLKRFSDLGAGYHIATHDLDIRGAGDLLGADQSGNIAAVGFDLYTELLGQAVEEAKGQAVHHDVEPDLNLPVRAILPEEYIPEPGRRLAYYQRMARAESDATVFDVVAEIGERYGALPAEVRYLGEVMVIRRRLKALGASALRMSVVEGEVRLGLTFVPEAAVDRADLVRRCQTESEKYRLLASGKLMITAPSSQPVNHLEDLRLARHEVGQLRTQGAFTAVARQ